MKDHARHAMMVAEEGPLGGRGRDVPEDDASVLGTGHQLLSVRAEGDIGDLVFVTAQHLLLGGAVGPPQPNGAVPARGGKVLTIRRERDAVNAIRVSRDHLAWRPVRRLP